MPVIVSQEDKDLQQRLTSAGAVVISQAEALTQDIRPAKIGLLNLMPAPAMESTENQWLRYISNTVLQVEPVLLKFDNDIRERDGASRKEILKRYIPFTQGVKDGLDGLIITGDNLEIIKDKTKHEALPFDEITYGDELRKVIDWARENVFSTIYSCLGSHFALNHIFGLHREISDKKIFGVFEHEIKQYSNHPILQRIDDTIKAPHSRWGNISIEEMNKADIEILAKSSKAGWLIASVANNAKGFDLFLQGHPEYDKYDLHSEFIRDWQEGQEMPADYYASNNPAALPKMTWSNDARAIHANWIAAMYKHFSGE